MSATISPARAYYSQHGEDVVLDTALADIERGVFVEVGCIDGRRFANTLALEERGWTEMCVEAHPAYIELLRRNRPGSVVVHAAVAEADADAVTFYANSRGSLSTLDPSLEGEFAERYGKWFTGFEPTRVPMRSISSLLDEHAMPDVDVLSIDVEGCDTRALMGLDLRRHRPRIVILEADRPDDLAAMDGMLLPRGYTRGFALSTNWFYFREPERLRALKGRTLGCRVTHTRHPLDETDGGVREFVWRI